MTACTGLAMMSWLLVASLSKQRDVNSMIKAGSTETQGPSTPLRSGRDDRLSTN